MPSMHELLSFLCWYGECCCSLLLRLRLQSNMGGEILIFKI
jgi:hypothetical protein